MNLNLVKFGIIVQKKDEYKKEGYFQIKCEVEGKILFQNKL